MGNYSVEGRELYQDKMIKLFDEREIVKIQNYYSLFMGFTVIPKEELSNGVIFLQMYIYTGIYRMQLCLPTTTYVQNLPFLVSQILTSFFFFNFVISFYSKTLT